MNVLMSQSAFEVVERAVQDGLRDKVEAGGSLVALELPGKTVLLYALPAGPAASTGGSHVVTDGAWQSRMIACIQRRIQGATYVGDWHVHPFWMPYLSETDRATATSILRDGEQRRSHLVLVLGTGRPGSPPSVLGFVASDTGSWGAQVEQVPVMAIDDGEAAAAAALETLPPLSELLREIEPVAAATFRHAAAARVESDLESIRRRFHATVQPVAPPGGPLAAQIRSGSVSVSVVFPPEYPVGAPLVLRGDVHGQLSAVPLRHGWSSLHRLDDLVAEALDGPQHTATKHAPVALTRADYQVPGGPRRTLADFFRALGRFLDGR